MAVYTLDSGDQSPKSEHETSQQYGDRLLAAHQAKRRTGNRAEFDKLESAAIDIESLRALNHAVIDVVETISGLVRPGGVRECNNLLHFARRATTLLYLHMDVSEKAAQKVDAAVAGWPL